MRGVIRFVRLLTMALWVGGLVFFAFAVAPVAFRRLPSAHEAGLVVGGTLRVLHYLGLACGGVFLLLTAAVRRRVGFRRVSIAEIVLDVAMLGLTAYSQFAVLPAMERYRVAVGGDVAATDAASPGRLQFERLHVLSERVEGVVLLLGLVVMYGLANEASVEARG